jgi:hypothetical protein
MIKATSWRILCTYVAGEFKFSYSGLGPTASRIVAVLLNTAMYFFGVQNISIRGPSFSIYDIPALVIGMILFVFFINTAWHETR